jgi:aminoglycoside phosphotransferase (APT) family kinase protein
MTASGMTSQENRVQEAAKRTRTRSLADMSAPLERWLADHLEVTGLTLQLRHPVGAGTSSETILASATWSWKGIARHRQVVFRLQPDGFQLFMDPRFDMQFDVMHVLHEDGTVRVPAPMFYESNAGVVGLPFFAMELVEGDVPVGDPHFATAGFLFDARADQRRIAWESAVRQLASVATVSLKNRAVLEPLAGLRTQAQEIEYWNRSATWACEGAVPAWLAALSEWLERNAPDEPDGLSWGDARIGNLAFGRDFRVKAVFDWEQATKAGIREDLGWWLLFDRYQVDGLGHPRLEGFGTREETIGLWEQVTGASAGDVSWFETFAGYKLSIIGIRALMLQENPAARSVTGTPVPRLALESSGLAASGAGS